jgi:hypothetical protein
LIYRANFRFRLSEERADPETNTGTSTGTSTGGSSQRSQAPFPRASSLHSANLPLTNRMAQSIGSAAPAGAIRNRRNVDMDSYPRTCPAELNDLRRAPTLMTGIAPTRGSSVGRA